MIWLNFDQWSSGARNGGTISHRFKRIYYKGRWIPFVIHWLALLPKISRETEGLKDV